MVEQLAGYALDALLHDSSASAVYRATRVADGASVVVKRAHGGSISARCLSRYCNEYDLLRAIDHPGVLKAHALVRNQGQLALILEEFPGLSLKQWLVAERPALLERLDAAIELAQIIGAVHAAGIIHKDVTAHNVLYDPATKRVKLVDFGIATRLRSEESKFRFPAALEGTLGYIAPEQTGRMNRSIDYRADWYSLGVTLYELFAGRLPHEGEDPLELVHFHIAGKPVPPCEAARDVPPALSDVVMKLMHKAPEDRYQSAAGVAADLRRCRAELAATGAVERFGLASEDVVDRFEPPQRLYGRGAETSALLDTFERVAGGAVEGVLVSGAGGIGKTSLVQEIHESITRRRGYYAFGKFDQLQQDVPFSALVNALQDLVEQLLTESEESVARWRQRILAAVGVNGQVLIDVIPALELIMGAQPGVHPLPGFEAQNRFKLVFQSFIQVFARQSHPLVLFLDDMQWADAASLNLVTMILSTPASESLLVVQAFRDNEVTATHPFMLAVKEQQGRGVPVLSIALTPLEPAEIARFLADSLHSQVDSVTALAEMIHAKTAGNPFFMRQFVQSLYADGLIWFDAQARTFRYDLAAIEAASITENVAEFLTSKLGRLAPETRQALTLAAAIGNRFDVGTLAAIDGSSESEAAALLQPAVVDGLIVPVSHIEALSAASGREQALGYRRFAFLHDRVQQAAYGMLPKAERPKRHLEIGRVLLAEARGEEADQRLFDIVNHMNHGQALIEDPAERTMLAELNLKAGVKARNSTAYGVAVRCFEHGVELLGEDEGWQSQPALTFNAHFRLAEALCLTADYRNAFAVIESTLERATSVPDRAKLHALKVNTYLSMGDMPAAVGYGRDAAEQLGVELPVDAGRVQSMLEAEIGKILERTAEIGVENLLDLPAMREPGDIAVMELLTHCLPAAYQTNQQLFALICCRMVSLSLERGNCPQSARAYGSFAALLSSALGKYADSHRFARLGVSLAHRHDDPSVYSGVYFLWAMFASHWNDPVDESIELFRQSVQYGLQTGDHPHVGYSAARRVTHQQFKGMQLLELRQEAQSALELLERIGETTNVPFLLPRMRFIDWLRGERRYGDTLAGEEGDEAQCTAAIQARGNRSFESDWYMLLARQRYLMGKYDAALEHALEAEKVLPYAAGHITRVEHNFYYSLIVTAIYEGADAARRAELDAVLDAHQAEFREWTEHCAENFRHMYLLVEAERARLRGAGPDAMHLYDEAIAAAVETGFIHVEALGAELAARFWQQSGKPDFASLYLERALNAYEIWGAFGKAADLRLANGLKPRRTAASASTAGATTMGGAGEHGDALDLATVLKASQAIAGEIVLERLLAKLMDIVLENAGGDLAVLVLETEGEFLVQAVKDGQSGSLKVMLGEPLRHSVAMSKGIVNYVLRTSEHVVLADPAVRGKFSSDAYVRNRRPKSVLCAPILHKGKLTGVVYLENNQIAGAFTPGRLEALNILMSQIAVSIENATLYTHQEQQARSIELANEALTKEIAERKHAEEELSRYRDHLEELVAQRTRELETAHGRVVALSRQAGMAEVASGVLHNVGNVMNSVNVGANVVSDTVKALPVEQLGKVCELLEQHAGNVGEFLSSDPRGRKVPEYLRKLAHTLVVEKEGVRAEINQVLEHLEHMKKIIAAQQTYAKVHGVTEVCSIKEIAETAVAISEAALRGSRVQLVRELADVPPALFDRHQILQILVNLISNAKHALEQGDPERRVLTISTAAEGGQVSVEVRDNGVGIPRENLAKIFNHGFTTKKTGHGFGLHNCANAAQQMDGSLEAFSDGSGRGARFVLRLPLRFAEKRVHAAAAGRADR